MLIPPSLLKGGERPGSRDLLLDSPPSSLPSAFSLLPRAASQGLKCVLPGGLSLPVFSIEAMIHLIPLEEE